MRIALITMAAPSSVHPFSGQYNLHQAQAMLKRGAVVELFQPVMRIPPLLGRFHKGMQRVSRTPHDWEHQGVRMHSVRGSIPHPVFVRWQIIRRSPRTGAWLIMRAFQRKLLRKLRDFKPDILLVHDGLMMGEMTRTLARTLNIPFAVIEHDAIELPRGSPLGDYYIGIVREARAVFGVGWPSVWCMRDELGLTQARLAPDGIIPATAQQRSTPRPPEYHGKKLVLCSGSPIPTKGHAELVRAFAEVNAPDGLLVLIGPQRPQVLALIDKLGLNARVKRLERMPVQDFQQWMVWADVFALPSTLESFGMVYAESLAAGTPVILTDACGIAPMLKHREHGWIVPVNDHGALVSALREALTTADLKAMGQTGRRLVDGVFTWDASARAVLAGLAGEPEPDQMRVAPPPAGWRPPDRGPGGA